MEASEKKIYEAIASVVDPEVGFDLVTLGLIYGVAIDGTSVKVTMTLSTRACPLHQSMTTWVKEAVERLDAVEHCDVEVVWEPSWNISMAHEKVQQALG